MIEPRHLRGTPVAVLIGDGLDAATPCYSDVAGEKTEAAEPAVLEASVSSSGPGRAALDLMRSDFGSSLLCFS